MISLAKRSGEILSDKKPYAPGGAVSTRENGLGLFMGAWSRTFQDTTRIVPGSFGGIVASDITTPFAAAVFVNTSGSDQPTMAPFSSSVNIAFPAPNLASRLYPGRRSISNVNVN